MNKMHSSLPILLLLALNCLARPAEDVGKDGAAVDPKTGMDGKMDQQQQPKGNGRMQSPPQFPDLPPQLEKVLPSDVVQKLKAVHVDPSLSFLDKQEKIDKIMTALPAEILDKIPAPPGFDRLPEDVRTKLKQIHRNKYKTWAQKQQEIQAYIQSLPTEQRAILMMPPPPPMGPPPPNFGGRR